MAAGLLEMVCGITLKSRKHEPSWPELSGVRQKLRVLREELTALAEDDARAYDGVVQAMRARKLNPGAETETGVQRALAHATEVPMRTVEKCLEVLRLAGRVAVLGSRSAYSDVGVGILLADAGMKGAELNVAINLDGASDEGWKGGIRARLDAQREEAAGLVEGSLEALARKN